MAGAAQSYNYFIIAQNGRRFEGISRTLRFTAIDGELKLLYRALEGRDMAAGSAVARRLFQ